MKNILVLTALLFASNCANKEKPKLTDEEKGTVVMDVKETLDNYYADIKSEGLTAEFKYLDSTRDFLWTPPGYTKPISFDSVSSLLKTNSQTHKEIDNSFVSLSIEAISIDSATYSGKIKSTITDSTGFTTTMFLVEKGTLVKRKDGWKLLHGETSISLNGK